MHSAARRETNNDDLAIGLGNAGFDIKAVEATPNSYRLTIKGFMSPGWTGRLTAALAKQQIGIVSGMAERVTTSAWHSSFELKCAPFAKDPLDIDYIALAGTELPDNRKVAKIALVEFTMEPCSRHEGSLYVEIRGLDRLGFLGDLLDYFSMRCLFPVKMSVETVANTAVDRFWLRGIGGSIPSESIAAAVKANMEQLLVCNA